MKILFITDKYGWDNWGTKPSLYEELNKRVEVELCLQEHLLPGSCDIRSSGHTHVFYASTGCCPPLGETAIKVGFGFSDPAQLDITRRYWGRFDHYFSLSNAVVEAAGDAGIDAHLFLPAVRVERYNTFVNSPKKHDAVMLGRIEGHPDGLARNQLVEHLRQHDLSVSQLSNLKGAELFKRVADARCGINVITPFSALSRTVLEYAACGLCVVSNRDLRMDVMFKPGVEYLSTRDSGLIDKIRDVNYCVQVAAAGNNRVWRDHKMLNRVNSILKVIVK